MVGGGRPFAYGLLLDIETEAFLNLTVGRDP